MEINGTFFFIYKKMFSVNKVFFKIAIFNFLQEKVADYREDGEIWFVIGFLPHTNGVDM
mgnify:CR=1 FL=1